MKSSVISQIFALLARNVLLKRRRWKQTCMEILSPLYFILLVIMTRKAASPTRLPEVPSFPTQSLSYSSLPGVLLVSPASQAVRDVMNDVIAAETYTQIYFFDSPKEAESFYMHNITDIEAILTVGVNFVSDGNATTKMKWERTTYSIRLPNEKIPATTSRYSKEVFCRTQSLEDRLCPASLYVTSGFVRLQHTIDKSIMKKLGISITTVLSTQQLPKSSNLPDQNYIQLMAAVSFVFAYAPFLNYLLVNLVTEKEKKIKEAMRMMGMKDSAFWISWSITYMAVLLVSCALVLLLVWGFGFFHNALSSLWLFGVLLFLYGMSVITMGFMLTSFFDKAQKAGAFGGLATLIFSAMYIPIGLTRVVGAEGPVSSIPVPGQWALCLMSPVALALAIEQSLFLDSHGGGMTLANLSVGQFPLQNSFIMLVIDVILYTLLAAYLDHVIPGEYGQRQPFYYFLLPSYWCANKSWRRTHNQCIQHDNNAFISLQDISANSSRTENVENREPQDCQGNRAIRLSNIQKTFKTSRKKSVKAVKDFTLDIYEGQITCLLGHNGAGKTTVINILTGMTAPTAGTATIFGQDISSAAGMSRIREESGVCPQHDVLYDDLTCFEHLRFFARIKGVPRQKVDAEVLSALKSVDLDQQAAMFSRALSGGQKRKLSVAIALIGDPKLMFLDEPTAGMDPYSRRHLWSLLKERRPGRVILLTTHFMDEADILADRKVFMSGGRLQCAGTSLFLKNRFGVGYHLGLVVKGGVNVEAITNLVRSHVSEATITRSHGNELTYTLPLSSVPSFPGLFHSLEALDASGLSTAESLAISSYGVSMTTLEEVFMKIGIMEEGSSDREDNDAAENENEEDAGVATPLLAGSPTSAVASPSNPLSQPTRAEPISSVLQAVERGDYGGHNEDIKATQLERRQFWALVKVRFYQHRRNSSLLFFRLVMPVLLIVVGLCLGKWTGPDFSSRFQAALYLNTSLYEDKEVLCQFNQDINEDEVTAFTSALEQYGMENIDAANSSTVFNEAPHNMGFSIHELNVQAKTINSDLTVQYNASAIHALPIVFNLLTNILLQLSYPSANITVSSHPWPLRHHALGGVEGAEGVGGVSEQGMVGRGAFGAALLIGLAIVNIPAGSAIAVVIERVSKVRGQLRVSGVGISTYWSAILFSDAASFYVVCFLCEILVVAIFQVPAFVHSGAILCLGLLLLCYVPVTLFLGYCLSFAFKSQETATTAISNIFLFGAFIPYIVVGVLELLQQSSAVHTFHLLATLLDPPYAVYGGLHYIEKLYMKRAILHGPDVDIPLVDYFKWNNHIIITIIAPIFHSVLLFLLLRFLEARQNGGDVRDMCCCKAGKHSKGKSHMENTDVQAGEDQDVKTERENVDAIMSSGLSDEPPVIVLHRLRKEFIDGSACTRGRKTRQVAVRNMSLAVEAGQVLGLLGPNGAGKTTALNCMIAEQMPTAGTVHVAGKEVRSALTSAFSHVGYCPQHNPLWEDITLKEHLLCYANIKGIAPQEAKLVTKRLMEALKITEHADKTTKKLSGGTKRKLCYALSMLGGPALVLLDEPSTGMDPQSKRFLWDTITAAFQEGGERGAVLTTHYMEEADALCSRVAIMINGEIKCLGSTQHLKDRHGSGYVLEVKLAPPSTQAQATSNQQDDSEEDSYQQQDEDQLGRFCNEVERTFDSAQLLEQFGDRVTFRIRQHSVGSLSRVFAWFEEGREKYGIEDYSFSQATLEQVFLEFAKQQNEERE